MNHGDWDEDENIPEHIEQLANAAIKSPIPTKSKAKYSRVYNKFMKWQTKNGLSSYSEKGFILYLSELAKKYAPSSVWCYFSMISSVIKAQEDIDIMKKYTHLKVFANNMAKGYLPKQSHVLTTIEVRNFLLKAPNDEFLTIKVRKTIVILFAQRHSFLCSGYLKYFEYWLPTYR